MTTYKSYAECKIAHPDSEIVTTGKNWIYDKELTGTFQPRVTEGCSHAINDYSWVSCNPADYCSSLKEFLESDLELVEGDAFINVDGSVEVVTQWTEDFVNAKGGGKDRARFILSASALNGGCNIPAKAEQWTIYNNAMPLCELTDEQYGKMRRAYEAGGQVKCSDNPANDDWEDLTLIIPSWKPINIYRIKSKSERELFIDKSKSIIGATTDDELVGAVIADLFDAGARYTDKTQFFGESI